MSLRVDRVLVGAALLGALVFACTSPVNDDVVINGRSEQPAFGGPDGSVTAPDAEGGAGLCPSNVCPEGRVSCANEAFPCGVDLMSDDNNCGACGVRCPQDDDFLLRFWGITQCASGACHLKCASGGADCNGLIDDGCEVVSLSTDDKNCGGCGIACQASERCSNGVCVCDGNTCPCPEGQTRCPSDQTCRDLQKDNYNCGACENVCPPSTEPPYAPELHMIRQCRRGKCNQPACEEKWADCNGDFASPNTDGCETGTADEKNCGSCGYACQAGEVCKDGKCTCSCGSSCFTAINADIDNCGTCGFQCPGARGGFTWTGLNPAHGNPACVQGVCEYQCSPNWTDCDNNIENGCETSTLNDPLNCGACGVRCDGIEDQACIDGRCLVKDCTVQ